MKYFFLALPCILALLMATPPAAGGDAPAGSGREIFPFVWAGLKDNRERLRRGVFRVKGRMIDDDPESRRLDGDMSLFCAFDYDKDLFRFDREEPQFFSKDPHIDRGEGLEALAEQARKRKDDPKDWIIKRAGGKWVKTDTQCIVWTIGGNAVSIERPHEEPDVLLKVFDVRTLGLLMWANQVDGGTSWKDTCNIYPGMPPPETVAERKGFYRFRWVEDGSPPFCTTLWVDESQGFSPVRLHWQEGTTTKDGIKWSEPSISEVESVLIGGVWVPRTFRIENRYPERFQSYQWTFEWESVNEPVSESLFTVEGMDLPKGTPIYDDRLGEPILKGRIGDEPPLIAGQSPPGFLRRNGVWLLVLGGVAVGGILLYWRVRSPKPTS